MKFHISINQKCLMDSNLGLDLTDGAILDFIKDFVNSESVTKLIHGGRMYYWISYKLVCDNLPILSLKKDTVYRKFKQYIDTGLLDAHPENKALNRAFFAINERFLSLFFDSADLRKNIRSTYGEKSVLPTEKNPEYYNITDHDIKNNLFESDDSKEKNSNTQEDQGSQEKDSRNLKEKKNTARARKEKDPLVAECYPGFVEAWCVAYPVLGFDALSGAKIKSIIRKTQAHVIGAGKVPEKSTMVPMFQYVLDYVKRTRHFCDGKPLTTWDTQYLSIIHEIKNGKQQRNNQSVREWASNL